MNISELLFWNVDTQFDFVSPEGKLYVEGAELLKPTWKRLTKIAVDNLIRVVNTADYHYTDSLELSSEPDFINTFPPHCMANSKGAEFVKETLPAKPLIIDWGKKLLSIDNFAGTRNLVIRKDAFDVFIGNSNTNKILEFLSPKVVVVYGVTTNVCVNDAVIGLSKRVNKVIVIEDAIKELPGIPLPFENWKKLGVEMISCNEFETRF